MVNSSLDVKVQKLSAGFVASNETKMKSWCKIAEVKFWSRLQITRAVFFVLFVQEGREVCVVRKPRYWSCGNTCPKTHSPFLLTTSRERTRSCHELLAGWLAGRAGLVCWDRRVLLVCGGLRKNDRTGFFNSEAMILEDFINFGSSWLRDGWFGWLARWAG